MDYTRREFGRLALATMPAVAMFDKTLIGSALAQAKPNSLFNGVQIGTITYSYRSMPDQSAEATLQYIVDSGISAVELMGGPVDSWARAKGNYAPPSGPPAAGGGRGGGRAGGGAAPGAPGGGGGGRGTPDPATLTAVWNGVPCAPAREGGAGGGGGRAAAPAAAPAAGGAAAAVPAAGQAARGGGGGGGRGGAPQTPEQIADAEYTRKWRQGLSMQIFKDLKKLYNDAGVTIYAVKNLSLNASDEDLEYQLTVAKTLGATHVTAELPGDAAALKRVGDAALKHGLTAAYHTHLQGSMTVFDEAFAASKGNFANVDLGHFVAGGNKGGTPMDFLNKFHDRTASFHLKDRTLPEHCGLNLAWGTGETPIKEILRLVAKNKWKIPASIELEYTVPQGSDAVKEVRKCVEYCKQALA